MSECTTIYKDSYMMNTRKLLSDSFCLFGAGDILNPPKADGKIRQIFGPVELKIRRREI